jgi:osmoprotectant transport system substrate-binding protein
VWQPARMRRPLVPLTLVAGAVLLAALASFGRASGDGPDQGEDVGPPPVRVAAGPDAESSLLAHTLVAMLAVEEVDARVVSFGDARDTRQALERGDVELRPGYTGEAWLEALGRADPPGDPRASFEEVRDHDAELGLLWFRPRFLPGLDTPPANATFAFVVAGPPSVDADLSTVSQLASRLSAQPDATLCVDPEFAARPDGLRAVLAAYSVRSDQPVLAAPPEDAVRGVRAGDCIAGLTTATDGLAWSAGLRPLVDDLAVFPAFVVLPHARRDALVARPVMSIAISPMADQLTTELLGRLNAQVTAGEPLEEVAAAAALELLRRAGREVPTDGGG